MSVSAEVSGPPKEHSGDSPPRSLRRNISWAVAGNIIYSGCQWGILVVLAKLGSPTLVGVFGLALAITAPVMMFASLQLRAVQATDASGRYEFRDYLGLRLVATALALLVIIAIALASGLQTEVAMVVIAMGVGKAFESISDTVSGLLQQHERMGRMAYLSTVKGVVSLAAMALLLWLTGSLFWGMIAVAVVWAIRLVAFDFPVAMRVMEAKTKQEILPRFHGKTMLQLALPVLPLGFATLPISLTTQVPRYFIEYHLDTHALGMFVVCASFMKLGNSFFTTLGQATTPRLAQYHQAGKSKAFLRLMAKTLGLSIGMGLIGLIAVTLAGGEILSILFTAEYAEQADVLFWVTLATVIFLQGWIEQLLISVKLFRALLLVSLLVLAVLTVLCTIFVPTYGVIGAAYALVGAGIARASIVGLVLWRLKPFTAEMPQPNPICEPRVA